MFKIKWIIFIISILLNLTPAYAQSTFSDTATQSIANIVTRNIFKELLYQKDFVPEFKEINDSALIKNNYGVDEIHYRSDTYDLIIHFVGSNREKDLEQDPAYAYWSFPVLGVKLSIYFKDETENEQMRKDIYKMISDHVQELYDHQQKYLPLQLELATSRMSYKKDEEIQFDVVLKNAGNNALRVASLNEDSLFCLIDKKTWGKENTKPKTQDKILHPTKSIKKTFKINVPDRTGEILIYCAYGLSHKGVKPYDILKIKVEGQ